MLGHARPDGDELLKTRAAAIFKVMARLKPGVTVAQAGAAAEIAGRHLAREYPDQHKGALVFVALEQYCRPSRSPRSSCRWSPPSSWRWWAWCCSSPAPTSPTSCLAPPRTPKEMGIRTAIGANRGRLIRQLLAESVLLACLAGVAGSRSQTGAGTCLARCLWARAMCRFASKGTGGIGAFSHSRSRPLSLPAS